MDEAVALAPPPKRSRRGPDREVRRMRIFARLQEGWSYDEIGREEGVTGERIRQIVKQALAAREVDASRDHALLQIARLGPALRLAAAEVAKGEVAAIAPLLRVLERLDKYQGVGALNGGGEYDEGARERLLTKLNTMALRMQQERQRKAEGADAAGRMGAPEEEAAEQDEIEHEGEIADETSPGRFPADGSDAGADVRAANERQSWPGAESPWGLGGDGGLGPRPAGNADP